MCGRSGASNAFQDHGLLRGQVSGISGWRCRAKTTLNGQKPAINMVGGLYVSSYIQSHISTGPIVRIAPNTLITCDEELIRRLNAARSPYRRNEWFRAVRFDADKENILSEIDPEKHSNMRSKVAPGVR
jgi:hypothetical protein